MMRLKISFEEVEVNGSIFIENVPAPNPFWDSWGDMITFGRDEEEEEDMNEI